MSFVLPRCGVDVDELGELHSGEIVDQTDTAIAHAEHAVAGLAFAPPTPHALQVDGGGHTRTRHALAPSCGGRAA